MKELDFILLVLKMEEGVINPEHKWLLGAREDKELTVP